MLTIQHQVGEKPKISDYKPCICSRVSTFKLGNKETKLLIEQVYINTSYFCDPKPTYNSDLIRTVFPDSSIKNIWTRTLI